MRRRSGSPRRRDGTARELVMSDRKRSGALAGLALLAVAGLGAAERDVRLVDAVKAGDKGAVSSLLRQRIDVNASEPDGTTALHWAVRQDDLQLTDQLIRNGADVKTANRYGITALYLASVNGSASMIEKLLKAGADANGTAPEGETVLMTVARTGNV